MKRCLRALCLVALLVVAAIPVAAQQAVLFDAAHAQTAGNADWTLDEDSCGIAQRYPTPDQAGITSTTAETYWNGAHSAMGVDLVKKGFHVESLPAGGRLSYGDTTNAQDLTGYKLLVLPEPNVRYTATEITAVRTFVQNGGGLFLIADHAGADRNNDGYDATQILNELMGSPSIFGITYNTNSADTTYGWFNDHPDVNYTTDTTSPIIYTGTYGVPSSTRGLGLFGSTSMTISGNAKGHVWRSVATRDTTAGVTYATSTYGSGRIAAIGDSSVTEDATNGCGHTTYLGYNDTSYDNGLLSANGVSWISNGVPATADTTAPVTAITAPADGATVSGTTSVTASASDNVGVVKVEFYLDNALKSTVTAAPYSWNWNTTSTANGGHTLASRAYDAANNTGTSATVTTTVSNVADTTAPSAPSALSVTTPSTGNTKRKLNLSWTASSDNVAVTGYQVWRSTNVGGPFGQIATTTVTTFADSGLASGITYYYFVKAYDAAGNISAASSVASGIAK